MAQHPPEAEVVLEMARWPRIQLNVLHEMMLDPDNVRLSIEVARDRQPSDNTPSQQEILWDLFENENAMELVSGILEVGFLTHETPVVIKRDGNYIVVEGNRRIAALKAIQNPQLVPDFSRRIIRARSQSQTAWENLVELEAQIAPDQDSANRLIAAIHTGRQRRPWTPARQSEFFTAQLKNGAELESLVRKYPTVQVKSLVLRSAVLELVREAEYENEDLQRYAQRKNFPLSVLERLYPNPEFRKLAGLSIDTENARAEVTGDQRQWNLVAEHLVAAIKDKKIDTRKLNRVDSPAYRQVLDDLRRHTDMDATEPTSETVKIAPRKTSKAPTRHKLQRIEHLTVPDHFPASIAQCLQELRDLNVRKFPNTTVDVIRTFLEKTCKAYRGLREGNINPKSDNKNTRSGLGVVLTWLEQHTKNQNKDIHQAVQHLGSVGLGRKDSVGGLKYLNTANHNPYIIFSQYDAHNAWDAVQPIIQWIFQVVNESPTTDS